MAKLAVCVMLNVICSIFASSAILLTSPVILTDGAPIGPLMISISVHAILPRHPVPSNFNTASLAANRPASFSVRVFKDSASDCSRAVNTRSRNLCSCLLSIDSIRSKSAAADWVINRLPEKYHPVLLRAKAICVGEAEEYWDDVYELIKPCADFMLSRSNDNISKIMLPNGLSRSIKIA